MMGTLTGGMAALAMVLAGRVTVEPFLFPLDGSLMSGDTAPILLADADNPWAVPQPRGKRNNFPDYIANPRYVTPEELKSFNQNRTARPSGSPSGQANTGAMQPVVPGGVYGMGYPAYPYMPLPGLNPYMSPFMATPYGGIPGINTYPGYGYPLQPGMVPNYNYGPGNPTPGQPDTGTSIPSGSGGIQGSAPQQYNQEIYDPGAAMPDTVPGFGGNPMSSPYGGSGWGIIPYEPSTGDVDSGSQ